MRLVLVGPPGSGKGTQAKLLVDRHQLRSIGTGDILRDAIRRGTPQGLRAEPFLKQGLLAPDDLVNDLVNELFRSAGRPERYVLDGYPRTHAQAVWFEALLADIGSSLTGVVQFEVSDAEVVRRISGRWGCPKCKAVYHTSDKPPKVAGVCDLDGEPLTQRDDDREEVIRARLKVFHSHTDGLLAHYRQRGLLRVVPSVGSIESIYNTTMSLLHVQA
jgi:adenylate kinase